MARRRMIDPNFWQSEDVSKLTIRQRLLLIGLFSNADDEGKLRGNPAFVRSIIFPYEDFSVSEIEEDLNAIESIGTILQYEVRGSKYIKLVNWDKFQRVDKPQPSMIPDPIDDDDDNDSYSNHDNETESNSDNHSENGSENVSESKSSLKENKRKENKDIYTHEFEEFWQVYPRKVSKKRAFSLWNRRIRDETPENLIHAAQNYAKLCELHKTEERYIKHPSTFLSDKLDYQDYLDTEIPDRKQQTVIDFAEERRRKEREEFELEVERNKWVEEHGTIDGFADYWKNRKANY